MPPTQEKIKHPAFFRRWDVLVLAALLLIGGIWLVLSLTQGNGAQATISLASGDTETTVLHVPLSQNEIIRITEDVPFPVTLEVQDGAIRFIHSQCRDHVCQDFGWLRREGEWALCAPAGVMVRVHAE